MASDKLIPADVVMTPDQEQTVMNRLAQDDELNVPSYPWDASRENFVGQKVQTDPRLIMRGDVGVGTTTTGDYGAWDNFQRSILFDTWMGEAYMAAHANQLAADQFGGPDIDPDYDPLLDEANYGYLEHVLDAKSAKEAAYRRTMVDWNTSGKQELEVGGAGVSRFLAQFVDPVNYAPLPATFGMRFMQAAKKSLAPSGAAISVSEGIRYNLDPTMTPEELAINVATGTILSSALVGGISHLGATAKSRAASFSETTQIVERVNGQKILRDAQTEMPMVEQFGVNLNPEVKVVKLNKEGAADNVEFETKINADGELEVKFDYDKLEAEWKAAEYRNPTTEGVKPVNFDFHSVQDFMRWKLAHEKAAKNLEPKRADETDVDYINRVNEEAKIIFAQNATAKLAVGPEHIKQLREAEKRLEGAQTRKDAAATKAADKRAKAKELRDKAAKSKSKSWATRWNKEAEKLEADAARIEKRLPQFDDVMRGLKDDVDRAEQNIFDIENNAEIGDLDFKATGIGLEKMSIAQMPFYRLVNNKIKAVAPDLAINLQKIAYAIAGSPGLMNDGARRGVSVGSSVEMHSKQWHNQYRKAINVTQKAYLKYAGISSDPSTARAQVEGIRQGLGFEVKGKRFGVKPPEGKMSLEEFRESVSRAMMNRDKADDPHVQEAVNAWREFFDAFDVAAKETNVYVNLKQAKINLDRAEAQFKEAKNSAFAVESVRKRYKEAHDAMIKAAEDAGKRPTPQQYEELFNSFDWEKEPLPFVSAMAWGKQSLAKKIHEDVITASKKFEETGELPKGAVAAKNSLLDEYEAYLKDIESVFNKYKDDSNFKFQDDIDRKTAEIITEHFAKLKPETQRWLEFEAPATDFEGVGKYTGFAMDVENGRVAGSHIFQLKESIESMRGSADEFNQVQFDKWAAKQNRIVAATDKELDILERIIQRRRDEGESSMGLEGARKVYTDKLDHYNAMLRKDPEERPFFHRMWRADKIDANPEKFKELIMRDLRRDPYIYKRGRRIKLDTSEAAISARADKIVSTLRKEANFNDHLGIINKGDGEGKRIGGPNAIVGRKLTIKEKDYAEFLEIDIDLVGQHYTYRMAPTIEMARRFGDFRLDQTIQDLHKQFSDAIAEAPQNRDILEAERKAAIQAIEDLRDKVLGTYGIPDRPDSLTNRTLRTLKAWNVLAYMGKAWMAALADAGRIAMSEGFSKTFKGVWRTHMDRLEKGRDSEWFRASQEVEMAGEAIDILMATRMHAITDGGPVMSAVNKFERWFQRQQGPFFFANMLSVWTDNAKRLAGSMIQSRMIEDSILWSQGKLPVERIERLAAAGINEKLAQRFARQWEEAGAQKGDHLFLANTEEWSDQALVREFRAIMAQEVNTAVITPHAADKLNFMSKPVGSVLMQYRGFGVSATQRIMMSAMQQRDKQALIGITSMIALAGMMDYIRRPDYVELEVDEQIFRAVEKSGVTGVFSDINSAIEIASGNQYGLRSVFGFQPVIKDPTWAERTGAPLGAVGTQWLNFVYALTDGAATGDEQASAMRYMIPYNNLWFWSDMWTRAQRSAAEVIEE